MSLRKKIVIAIISVLIFLGLGSFIRIHTNSSTENKAIHVVVIDETTNKTVFDKVLRSESETLKDFLVEQTSMKVELQDGSYITSMLDLTSDAKQGPWWVYESENNEVCLAQKMCPAVNEVVMQDGDVFTFRFKKEISY